jgi:hypothetical protein
LADGEVCTLIRLKRALMPNISIRPYSLAFANDVK